MLLDNVISSDGGKLYPFGIDHIKATGDRWLKISSGAPSNVSGYRVAKARTITSISLQTNASNTGTIQIIKNTSTVLTSISLSSESGKSTIGLSISLSAGDVLRAKISAGEFDYPSLIVETV